MEPTFSSTVKITPTHSPPAGVVQGSEPFVRPTQSESSSSQFPGSVSSALQHQPASQTQTIALSSVPTSPSMLPGTGFSSTQHQLASKARTTVSSATTVLPGIGFSASQHEPASKAQTKKPTATAQLPAPGSSVNTSLLPSSSLLINLNQTTL